MYGEIQGAFAHLQYALQAFNHVWPNHVVSSVVWRLPLLSEQRTPDTLQVLRLVGQEAVDATQIALAEFERDLGQAPGTVMRLPGYFVLSESVLDQVRQINALKDEVAAAIEKLRLELNLVPAARPRLMRRALGAKFNTKQLLRHIQCFDGAPRLITFTWAGHTTATGRVTVAKVRETLQAGAEARASRENTRIEDTPEYQELRTLVNMANTAVLTERKSVAPHPRAMLWFSNSSRYDAMIHANLPVFVKAGEQPPEVIELKNFDRNARQAKRFDEKRRTEVLPFRDLFLPSRKTDGAASVPNKVEEADVASTYRI
ncbi:DNA replication terminus site-binding protein [Azotobacter beijerinckii]|uniref:DNA replication terminus site binding protein n=1 Tax=Azotobacter beijerinckii TaxID=170623 RepID=A0A1I4IFG1_9GAMM|nr:DNA replication terminus site-binding protein [Azotobacter beijerinckii]SFB59480.1 DNA replication terminus site binding protein [Azotobacter beijerinckii]SFL52551.1 DNA replication terminus site binding protein [Azotobacter beijerinckii]